MAFIPTPLTAKAAIEYTLFGRTVVNTLWFESALEEEFNTGLCQDVALLLEAWLKDDILVFLSDDIDLTRITVTAQHSNTGAFYNLGIVAGNGGIAGNSASSKLACCISIKTGARGRSYRGRNYVAGIPETVLTGNTLSSIFVGDLVAGYNALLTSIGSSFRWVVVSHYANGSPRAQGVTVPVTYAESINNTIEVQRRRD